MNDDTNEISEFGLYSIQWSNKIVTFDENDH